MIIDYRSNRQDIDRRIRNLDQLLRGLKCPFLLVLNAHNGDLVAVQWKRKAPKKINSGYTLIKF